jgi:hypothetical protein
LFFPHVVTRDPSFEITSRWEKRRLCIFFVYSRKGKRNEISSNFTPTPTHFSELPAPSQEGFVAKRRKNWKKKTKVREALTKEMASV